MKTVLIVDDALFIRLKLRTILEENGFKVVGEAEDGETGVKMYDQYKPDLVTMDITMPGMGGLTALKTILSQYPEAKIVMVSAMGHQTPIKEAMLSGARYFLTKPFKEDKVLETLNKVFAM